MWQIVYSVLSLGVSCQFVNSASRRHVLQLQIFCLFCCRMWTTSFLFSCDFFFARRFGIYIEQFCIRELMTCVFRKCSNKMNVIFFSCVYIRSTHVDWAKMRKHIRVGIHDAFAWGAYFYVSFQMNHSWASTRNECKFSCNCFFSALLLFQSSLSVCVVTMKYVPWFVECYQLQKNEKIQLNHKRQQSKDCQRRKIKIKHVELIFPLSHCKVVYLSMS